MQKTLTIEDFADAVRLLQRSSGSSDLDEALNAIKTLNGMQSSISAMILGRSVQGEPLDLGQLQHTLAATIVATVTLAHLYRGISLQAILHTGLEDLQAEIDNKKKEKNTWQ